MTSFTPLSALAGGALIGLASVALLLLNGRIAGVSSITSGLLGRAPGDVAWRLLFLAGLAVGAGLWIAAGHPAPAARAGFPGGLLVLAGLLVGYGTSLGSGCTSGHGVCGLGRLSARSLVATGVFLVTALIATFVVRHLLGIA